jgi:hypothetical protein
MRIALSEAAGIPNNGDMHIVERIRVDDADTLAVELTIAAPKVLADMEAILADGKVMTYSTELRE